MCTLPSHLGMSIPVEHGQAAQASTAAAAATWPMHHAYHRVIQKHPHAYPPVVVLATAAAVCALLCASRAASTRLSATSLACGQTAVTRATAVSILRLTSKVAVAYWGWPVTNIHILPSLQGKSDAGRQMHAGSSTQPGGAPSP